MIAYKFLSNINPNGTITLPDYIGALTQDKVEVIILLPEEAKATTVSFYDLIEEYATIDEPELNTEEIYHRRN